MASFTSRVLAACLLERPRNDASKDHGRAAMAQQQALRIIGTTPSRKPLHWTLADDSGHEIGIVLAAGLMAADADIA